MFSYKFFEIFKKTFITEHLWTAASENAWNISDLVDKFQELQRDFKII